LLDSNLLLLFIVGKTSLEFVERHKRTRDKFGKDDYQRLIKITNQFFTLITTAHILAEVSNLIGQSAEPVRTQYFQTLADTIDGLTEVTDSARDIIKLPEYFMFGLTDAAICLAARRDYLVLTIDGALANHLNKFEERAVNFNYLRGY